MPLSRKLNAAIDQQIGREFGASLQYLSIAAYFSEEGLLGLADFFNQQGDEERAHALRFAKYILDAGGHLEIPAIGSPQHVFKSLVEAIKLSLAWEQEVTNQINRLVALAVEEKDPTTQNFLNWFLNEQIEEVATMETLLKVARRAGENVLLVDEFIVRQGAKLRGGGAGKPAAD
jgi:bacterioferritin B